MAGELTAYLPLCVVAIGWLVADHHNNKRETRKEARTTIDAAKKSIIEIAKGAVDYMLDTRKETAHEIKAGLDALEVELERIKNFGVHDGPLMSRFIAFTEAVTGGDFESSQRTALSGGSPEVAAVMRKRNELIAELERQFKAYYLP